MERTQNKLESAHKVNSVDENSPAAPTGNRSCNLSITSHPDSRFMLGLPYRQKFVFWEPVYNPRALNSREPDSVAFVTSVDRQGNLFIFRHGPT